MAGALDEKLLLYAEDSAIFVSYKDVTYIELLLQKEISVVSEWLIDIKLSLHLGKTESILFGSLPRIRSESVLNITCKCTIIEGKNSVEYMGATLEQLWSKAFLVKQW